MNYYLNNSFFLEISNFNIYLISKLNCFNDFYSEMA